MAIKVKMIFEAEIYSITHPDINKLREALSYALEQQLVPIGFYEMDKITFTKGNNYEI